MKRALALFLSICLVTVAVRAEDEKPDASKPGELTDPLEIVKKVDAAAKAVNSVKYNVVWEGLEAAAAQTPKVEASVIASGLVNATPQKYFIDAKITFPNSSEPLRITCGTDNDMFFVIHHHTKTAYEDIDPAVMGNVARFFQRALMIEYIHPTPFTDEINGRSRELRGSKTIDGEDCYEVHVVYAVEQAPQATWYFSKRDFLPRGRIDSMVRGEQRFVWQKMVSGLVANPKLDDEVFKLKLPEGYKKTDDFAPDITPPR
jgi:hypothetical protein